MVKREVGKSVEGRDEQRGRSGKGGGGCEEGDGEARSFVRGEEEVGGAEEGSRSEQGCVQSSRTVRRPAGGDHSQRGAATSPRHCGVLLLRSSKPRL